MALIVQNTAQQPVSDADRAMLSHLPEHQRSRILSGMRWTVWLSALAAPFGLAINFLLARVGPETLGVYGLLGVYVALTSAFMYFGGDSVIMRFIPDCCADDRASFLLSYLIVILAVISGWLVFVWFCPAAMRLVLGKTGGDRFLFLILCLAVVPIIFAMVIACLKGMLEIRLSQVLAKLATITSLVFYAALFVFDRALLSAHPLAVVWSVYLGTTAILAVVGGVRLIRLFHAPRLHWYLPDGFWRYSIHTQQVSFTAFAAARLDYVLIVGFGGLALLGKYVAVLAVATIVWMVNGFFMDTLLPSLTNTIAARNYAGAAQVFTMHVRILFLVVTAASCVVMVLAAPATTILGPKYASLGGPIIFMSLCFGLASPGTVGGTVLSSISRQQLGVWANVLNLCLFVGLFLVLWPHWNLAGAVVAHGTALVISYGILVAIARRTARFLPSIYGLWIRAAVLQAMVGFVSWWWMPIGLFTAALVWLAAMVIFLVIAQYSLSECMNLSRTFLPGSLRSASNSAKAPIAESVQSGAALH
jgi:O-antigen/teichoic acid export membrane protein